MNLRLANRNDLSQLKVVYKEIIKNMDENDVCIWDEIYPCEFLEDDIENNQLYVLMDNDKIAAAFALCDSNEGAEHVTWKEENTSALYIDRLGVNINYLRKGIGSIMLNKALEIAREKGVQYLRLFVVDINEPAINLYKKSGFEMAQGIYDEVIEDYVLREYGFERATI